MNKKTRKQLTTIIVILVVIIAGYAASKALAQPGPLDDFAKCLEEKNATFYGAFWCPHCKNQKDMFGRSQKHIPYFECSTADGKSQIQACDDKEMKSFPTWEFEDGTRLLGEVTLQELAAKTGCELPQEL